MHIKFIYLKMHFGFFAIAVDTRFKGTFFSRNQKSDVKMKINTKS